MGQQILMTSIIELILNFKILYIYEYDGAHISSCTLRRFDFTINEEMCASARDSILLLYVQLQPHINLFLKELIFILT